MLSFEAPGKVSVLLFLSEACLKFTEAGIICYVAVDVWMIVRPALSLRSSLLLMVMLRPPCNCNRLKKGRPSSRGRPGSRGRRSMLILAVVLALLLWSRACSLLVLLLLVQDAHYVSSQGVVMTSSLQGGPTAMVERSL